MVVCEKLNELDRARVREVLDLLDRMHSGRPLDESLKARVHGVDALHCPFHNASGELSEQCLNGCRVEELINQGKLSP